MKTIFLSACACLCAWFSGFAQLSSAEAEQKIMANKAAGLSRYEGLAVEYKALYPSGGTFMSLSEIKTLLGEHLPEAYDVAIQPGAGETVLFFKLPGHVAFARVEEIARLVSSALKEVKKNGFYDLKKN